MGLIFLLLYKPVILCGIIESSLKPFQALLL